MCTSVLATYLGGRERERECVRGRGFDSSPAHFSFRVAPLPRATKHKSIMNSASGFSSSIDIPLKDEWTLLARKEANEARCVHRQLYFGASWEAGARTVSRALEVPQVPEVKVPPVDISPIVLVRMGTVRRRGLAVPPPRHGDELPLKLYSLGFPPSSSLLPKLLLKSAKGKDNISIWKDSQKKKPVVGEPAAVPRAGQNTLERDGKAEG